MNTRSRSFVFTINNFTQEEEELIMNLENDPAVVDIVAEEEHLEEGTPHIQGFIKFANARYRNSICRFLGGRAFVEIARGSLEANINYCSKEDHLIVKKITSSMNKNYDKERSADKKAKQIITGVKELSENDFASTFPNFYLYHRNIYDRFRMEEQLKKLKTWNGELRTKNLWIYGPAGVGKSTLARKGLEAFEIYSKAFNKWWNGFEPSCHQRVVLDDYPSSPQGDTLVQHMKIWGDRYVFIGEEKGGHLTIEPNFQFVVTSNFSIDECFNKEQDREAIRRRFREVYLDSRKENLDEWLASVLLE
nr:replicase [Donkey kirkovirus Hetian-7]